MKATNNPFATAKVTAIPVPELCKQEPTNFEKYIWESQNGRFTNIKDFDEMHLINVYNMLMSTIAFAKIKQKHKPLSASVQQVLRHAAYHLRYIGHELYLRQYRYMDNIYDEAKFKYNGTLRELSG